MLIILITTRIDKSTYGPGASMFYFVIAIVINVEPMVIFFVKL